MRECKCGHASRRISVAILDREEEEGSHQESRRHTEKSVRGGCALPKTEEGYGLERDGTCLIVIEELFLFQDCGGFCY